MLNASRRHRLGHSARRSLASSSVCAQRLSASQTWSRSLSPLVSVGLSGAQRLSASQTWSRRIRRGGVLRHDGCSTPLGVTDLVTAATRGAHPMIAVLNASRRHRLGHSSSVTRPAPTSRCSTPLGVTDLVTPRRRNRHLTRTACSTPLGVTDLVTRRGRTSGQWDAAVLNASRRHRLGHGFAQLLPLAGRLVLNASRRHRLGHHRAGRGELSRAGCSTPLGVTDLVTSVIRRGPRRKK